jgi:uncharacterized membrane protein YbhN (UPF0104 family)
MARGYLDDSLPGFSSRRSLAARGQFLNTFAGITFCVSFSLLALGGYLLEEQFQNPLQAQSIALLLAALLIATATTFLFCLLHSSRRLRHRVAAWPLPASGEKKTLEVGRYNMEARIADRTVRPSHGRFVDRTLIHLGR